MPINIEDVLERAFEQAFLKALEQTVQVKAEELFRKALSPGSPVAQKLQEKMEQGFQRFFEEEICWDKDQPGLTENKAAEPQPAALDEDVLDGDAYSPPPPKRSGTIQVQLRYVGRGKPMPFDIPEDS